MRAELEAEFNAKYEEEERRIQDQISEFLESKGELDPDALKGMPDDWIQFNV